MLNVPDWVGIITPLFSGAAGVGVGVGIMKTRLSEHDRRIESLEKLVSVQVGERRCAMFRADCRTDLKEDVKDIKDELKENRQWLQKKFDELSRFIGRMDQAETDRRKKQDVHL